MLTGIFDAGLSLTINLGKFLNKQESAFNVHKLSKDQDVMYVREVRF